LRLEKFRAAFISRVSFGMLAAVYFDDEVQVMAGKVNNVRTELHLSTKVGVPCAQSITQTPPHFRSASVGARRMA